MSKKAILRNSKPLDSELENLESIIIENLGEINQYTINEISIGIGKDGHVSFSADNSESFIYFYPEQIKHLRLALRKLPKGLGHDPKVEVEG